VKLRTGFVSNSSSTAFLVGLDEIPRNFCELEEMFWQDKPTVGLYHDSSLIDMSTTAFSILRESVNTNGLVENKERAMKLVDRHGMLEARDFIELIEKWDSLFKGKKVVYMEVSDEGSHVGSDLQEYMRDILPRRLPCIAISKH
jgi:hypothetical protein